ncbi:PERQ amino acid-rich with GYF domain-containing protein [Schistosoma bovis]|uniref:PERQ amino acid-rich with GYF domain-containing protein n=1 Tax=Schistosoma bovis TaxID=6184 RepID=A0A430Q309_SCHBO|nr:PERQ amino acid-rich with GYF domain-containing protein [Schistosoma bovis]
MTAQPESFQFSPQWIRELSDDAFNSRRQQSHSPTEGRVSSKSPNLFSNFVNKVPDTISLNTTGHSLPSSSARPLEVQHVGGSLLSGNSSVVSNPTLNINSILPNDGIPVPRSDPYSHNTDSYNNQSKRAVSAYYGINDPDKTLDSSVNSNAIWMQQHIWSKSVPQHLHGFNPIDSTSNSVSNFCGVAATETNRHSSCSVPDAENIRGFFSQLSSFDRLGQSNSSQAYPLSNSSVQHPPNVLSSEKGFVRRNGSDQSDEHMWLYEDPQGRTQGTFSDAQMNEWLMAGIYFTPNLRIRRQCDDTFSTLASYTQLFERVPFVSGPRIPPIRGEINQAMLALSSSGFLSKPHFKNSDNPPTDLLPCNSTNHDQSEGSRVNASMVANSTIDSSRSLLSEPQHQLYQQLSDFSTSASNITTSAGISVPTCQVTEEGLNTTNSKSLAYGSINTSVPVSVPMSLLNNSINNLRIRDNAEGDFKSILDDPNNVQQHKQAISSAPTFMNLTSLIPLNPSFPSFNLQFPSRLQGTNGTTMDDLTSAASSFLSPGFWSVLTQYLNLHPPSANQTSTPMQQLAETAQLAAQLAALVGSHSPDQTPMQPSQALALAQLLITRGVGLGNINAEAPSSNGLLTSKKDKPSDNECIASSSIFHTSEISAVSERHQESQTQWPSLGSTLNQSAPHCSEGRFNPAPLNKVSSELSYGKSCEKDLSDNTSAVSQNLHSCRPNYLDKPQSTLSKPSTSPRSTNVKSKIQLDSTLSEPVQSISLDGYNRTQQNGRGPKTTEVCSGGSVRSTEQKQTAISSSRTGSTNQSRVKGSKSNNVRSPTKAIVQNNSSSSQVSSSVNIRPTEAACTSVASNSETDPDQTVEDELKKLTQWCQSRLGSMPMREKVDIPTVVELLATLDAPYEVERMVQTFLGETARTAQFVKDFLDRRRPFWQLHRKRREQENTIQESAGQNSNQPASTVRSTEKKKRTNPNDTATNNTQRQNSSICNGLSWNKSDSTHSSNIEQIQDNQVGILSI